MQKSKFFEEEIKNTLVTARDHNEATENIADTLNAFLTNMLISKQYDFGDYRSAGFFEVLVRLLKDDPRSKNARYRRLMHIFITVAKKLSTNYPYEADFIVSRLYYKSYWYAWLLAFTEKRVIDFLKFTLLLLTIPHLWCSLTIFFWITFAFLFYWTKTIPGLTDAFYSSIITFTSMGVYRASLDGIGKFLVGLEVVLGYFMLGILISIIIRKILRW